MESFLSFVPRAILANFDGSNHSKLGESMVGFMLLLADSDLIFAWDVIFFLLSFLFACFLLGFQFLSSSCVFLLTLLSQNLLLVSSLQNHLCLCKILATLLVYCQNPNSTKSSIQQSLRLDYIITERSTPPTTQTLHVGPSGVHALPLAAGINEGGHYFRY